MFGHLGRGAVHGAKQDVRALNHHITEDDLVKIIGSSVIAAKSVGANANRFGKWAQNPTHDPVRATYRTLRHPGDKGKPVGYTRSLFVNPDKNHPYQLWPPKEMLRTADNAVGAWAALNPSTLLYPEAQKLGLAGKEMPEWRKEQGNHIGAILSGLPAASVESGMPLDNMLTKTLRAGQRQGAPTLTNRFGTTLLEGAEHLSRDDPSYVRRADRLSGAAVKVGAKRKADILALLNAAVPAPPLYFHGGPHPTSHRLYGRQVNRPALHNVHAIRRDLQVPDAMRAFKTDAELRFPTDKIAQGLYIAHRAHLHDITARQAAIALQSGGGTALEHGLSAHAHGAAINVPGTAAEVEGGKAIAGASEAEGTAAEGKKGPPKMPVTKAKAPAHLTGHMRGAKGYQGRN